MFFAENLHDFLVLLVTSRISRLDHIEFSSFTPASPHPQVQDSGMLLGLCIALYLLNRAVVLFTRVPAEKLINRRRILSDLNQIGRQVFDTRITVSKGNILRDATAVDRCHMFI